MINEKGLKEATQVMAAYYGDKPTSWEIELEEAIKAYLPHHESELAEAARYACNALSIEIQCLTAPEYAKLKRNWEKRLSKWQKALAKHKGEGV